jgi:hypothetical protein
MMNNPALLTDMGNIFWDDGPTAFSLVLAPTICYAAAAFMYAKKHNWPLVVTYSGYAWANVGLLWMDRILNK